VERHDEDADLHPVSQKYNCGCETGKSCFTSWDVARVHVKHFRRRRSSYKHERQCLGVYRCKICRCWHVGNRQRILDGRKNPLKKHEGVSKEEARAAWIRWQENLLKVEGRVAEAARLRSQENLEKADEQAGEIHGGED
jgi:hypothetical protein